MGRLTVAWLLGVWFSGAAVSAAAPNEPLSPGKTALKRFEFSQVEMAVPVSIILYASDTDVATRAAKAAFARVHSLNSVLSDYDPESELNRLSRATAEGGGVKVSEDLWRVLSHAQTLAERSDGAFDVTIGPVVRLWRRARRQGRLPSAQRLRAARQVVGHHLVRLDPDKRTVTLRKPGMQLDLGGIAKGYAVDEALAVLRKSGIKRALVDAGGDMAMGAPPPGKTGWRIGIARLQADGPPTRILTLWRVAVATSGDTWQYVEIDGRRYSHIVDPRTGLGLSDHSSVTVIAPTCMAADALASAVSVLGPEKGLKLIETTPSTAAFIMRAPEGKMETFQSRGWRAFSGATPTSKSQ